MAQQSLSLREAQWRIAAVDTALKVGHRPPQEAGSGPSAVSVAADALGLSRVSMRGCLARIEQVHKIAPDWSLWKAPDAVGTIAAPAPVADRSLQRLKDNLASTQRALRQQQREDNANEDMRAALFGLAAVPIRPKIWTPAKRSAASGPGVPVLLTSDFQWGEVVRPDEVDGINEFNIAVAHRRYRRLIATTIHLCFDHAVKPKYPGMVYLRGGDAINGEIHEEFLRSNELTSVPAVRDLIETEAAGIQALADRFGRVHVATVPGNHGRTTRKSWASGYVDMNYETLIAWMLEREFRKDRRITFATPESGDYYFSIYGTHLLMSHGDRIGSRGGQGFIGPQATILRGHYKMIRQYARLGLQVDCVLTGHFHTRVEWDHGIGNGSLVGPNPFALKEIRADPEPPSQTLFYVHERFGRTHSFPIFVDDVPPASDAPWLWDKFMDDLRSRERAA